MKIPEGYTEAEVLDIINRISSRLANKFKFGYHDTSDMKQQASLYAWQGLEKYDGIRPLENFLWIHVRNRLYNFKRNNYARPDKPCLNCPLSAYIDGKCTAFSNEMDCEFYSKWFERNEVKKSLMSTKEHADLTPNESLPIEDQVLSQEIYRLVDNNIPAHMREDWLRFTHKLKLSKNKRDKLLETITQILEDHGIVT